MECKNCKYLNKEIGWNNFDVCKITSRVNPISCNIKNDEDVKNMRICYNCHHWYGGGDWGLSCAKNYYDCSSDGFREACDKFLRKE
jgi:hypothetical protein